MNCKEFEKLIKSIGFDYDVSEHIYIYKHFGIDLYNECYNFYNGYEWNGGYYYNDLKNIENNFKKELRSIKLKQLLG